MTFFFNWVSYLLVSERVAEKGDIGHNPATYSGGGNVGIQRPCKNQFDSEFIDHSLQ